METKYVLEKLENLETIIKQQNILKKDVLNMEEACQYLRLSKSHMYKLTSQRAIPHFCPEGKRLYFKREELDQWLLRNRIDSKEEIQTMAADYLINNNTIRL